MKLNTFKIYFFTILCIIYLSGCSGSDDSNEDSDNEEEVLKETEEVNLSENTLESEILWNSIEKAAREEQQKPMYSRTQDSAYLYWLNNQLIISDNYSKCNIFALNVLYKSGCKCPEENALSYDLMDTLKFNDIFPVIYKCIDDINNNEDISDKNIIRKGDLMIWEGHVIIFESFVTLNEKLFANAWWSGTNQINNGENIINDVVQGKYPVEGEYVIRRPVLRK